VPARIERDDVVSGVAKRLPRALPGVPRLAAAML
jgi:hypothetical protein